jgi:hypothetical protein
MKRICEKQPDGDKTGGTKGDGKHMSEPSVTSAQPAANKTHELVHNLTSYSIVVVARYLLPQ